jgi:NADPH2:quinone reductase
MEIRNLPDLSPSAGQVVIQVAAAGLNRGDIVQREGSQAGYAASPILGYEVSGVVREVGTGVTEVKVGDEVIALVAGGGYAQQVAVPALQVVPLPDGVDLVTAAGIIEVAATVYSNLFMTAHLSAGETVLIHGASGGIGTMAIQLAKALGARVAVTAGSAEKLKVAAGLGAEILINYRDQDFVAEAISATDGRGVDVILDVVGGAYLAKNIAALGEDGRLVVIGMQGGTTAELNLAELAAKRASVTGAFLRSRSPEQKGAILRELRERVWPLITAGEVRILVDRTFALEDIVAAHEYFDSGDHIGKVLLTM